MVIKQKMNGEVIVGTGKRWVGPFESYGEAQVWCECEGAESIKNGGVMRDTVELEAPDAPAVEAPAAFVEPEQFKAIQEGKPVPPSKKGKGKKGGK